MPLEFAFDRNAQRYRYTSGAGKGQFVSEEAVKNLILKAIALVEKDINTLAQLLIDGKISVATWEQSTALALKCAHAWNYLLGTGGVKGTSNRDRGILGAQLKNQYQYLRGFSQEIINTGMSEAQFRARVQLYVLAARGSFERSRLESHMKSGWNWERRDRSKLESCQPCVSYELAGWQPIGTLPNPMQACNCRSRCGCSKRFAKGKKPTDSLLDGRFGWVNGLSNLSLRINRR
ncbi:MAG: hypothetical protein AB1861_08435 [Cyanobacteriota bacterium]